MDIDARGDDDDDPLLPVVTSKWIKRLLFLGTGTSGQIPALGCLLHKTNDFSKPCIACHDSIRPGSKNRRGCTSAAIIGQGDANRESLILIDCGPSFYTSILQHIDAQDLGSIDAILLTHAHADALLGLDSLRSWTMGGTVQDYVDVYCTRECFKTICSMFPYLVDKSKSTGGGGVGDVRFHMIDSKSSFQVKLLSGDQVIVTPLPAHHGQVQGKPFECLGFRIDSLSYLSDCHYIPASTSQLMAGSQVVVIDALNPYRHASHFSLSQALSFIFSMSSPAPRLSLLTDLTHNLEHYETERSIQRWRSGLIAWRIEQESRGWTEPKISEVGRAEGGGARWWNGKWDEKRCEQRGATLSLIDEQLYNGDSINHSKYPDGPSLTAIPHIHIAWDGMVIKFEDEKGALAM